MLFFGSEQESVSNFVSDVFLREIEGESKLHFWLSKCWKHKISKRISILKFMHSMEREKRENLLDFGFS
jgi:hypothetical protein